MDELLTKSVRELAGLVRSGELSPVDLLDAHIKRIREVNPFINAVISERFTEARAEAKSAAERLAKSRENLPPLFGIPCTIKDTYAVKDLPWVVGVWARRGLVADWDATVVKRVRDAGAIIMGKTNVPEAAMWCETYNHVYGRTKNPYDLTRGAGGSSGGEAAIIAAGGSPFGIGSDAGGSIRYPSAFNGVPGHKPTGGLVPSTGHWPQALGPVAHFCTYGPLARRVGDLSYILPLLAGPDGEDKAVEKRQPGLFDHADRSRLKVYYFDQNGQSRCDSEVVRALGMAAGAFAGMKIPVEYWRPEGVENSLELWQAAFSQNQEPFRHYLEGDQPLHLGKETLRFVLRQSKITLPALGTALVEKPGQFLKGRNRKYIDLGLDLQRRIEEKLGQNAVIICPVFPKPAPKHTRIWLDFLGIGYSGLFNILEFPATVVPIFHRPDGVPVSVQVVAGRFCDHLTLAVAELLEQVFGGWKPAKLI
jgi:fatty acid amide hydrolase 2